MRFSLPDSYYEFFLRNQVLEIEDLLSEQETKDLCEQTEAILLKKLHQKPLEVTSNLEIWQKGKNHWLESPEIKKILFRLQLGEICHFLFKKRPIRLAYSQAFFTGNQQDTFISAPKTLEEISCSDSLLGGALFCLEAPAESEKSTLPNLEMMKKGSVIFFSEKHQIPFPSLFAQKGFKAILLGFGQGSMRYKLEPQDPNTHELKKSGYVFGDLIQEDIAPYLYR